HVCFTPQSRHVRCNDRCRLWANSGHPHLSQRVKSHCARPRKVEGAGNFKSMKLLGSEAVEEPVAAGGDQVFLGATAGRVGRIPGPSERHIGLRILGTGHWRKSRAINMSEHGDTRAAAAPV